ncbi:hypothetical protein AQUCO_02000170v1 [Aquilegia coerulea]|uniref:Cytochrome c oxidase subunit 5b n=1 Tax=Aquilegia coerulea TaxID=218851 RepID=A0A2G5DG98_AQUCA|nr:hypothetical protein AQUCO_02000170v1 [Aquilegia coerulea]
MWRRVSKQLQQTLIRCRSDLILNRSVPILQQQISRNVVSSNPISSYTPSFLFTHHFSSDADTILSKGKKKVEDVMPIATGHEREELEAALEGRDLLDINHPAGPFGTKEEPAVIKSYYDKRIVGCPGGEGGKSLVVFLPSSFCLPLHSTVHTLLAFR